MQTTQAAPPSTSDLPDIGTPADEVFSRSDEYQIGSMVARELREAGRILDDPETTEYIQAIGASLSSRAQEGTQKFTFFVLKDPSINAFAVPGGFVFVHSGLILSTTSESELAGVLAHEISHVTQRHIARSIEAQSRGSLASTAAMLGSVLLGALSHSSQVGMAGVIAGQNAAIQQQLNFSREDEYEADRVGMGVMDLAGYDPKAMATFFETLSNRMGSGGPNAKLLEILQTHPVTSARVAEARNRATAYPIVRPVDTTGYRLTRERLRVMTFSLDTNPRDVYTDTTALDSKVNDYRRYGRAIGLMQTNAGSEAVPILRDLVARHHVDCWLVNTGWTGGRVGTGRRMPIRVTRRLLTAALDGSLHNAKFRTDPHFGLAVPTEVPGVEPHILDPIKTWRNKGEFAEVAGRLVQMFRDNFKKFEDHTDGDVRNAGPTSLIKLA